MINKIMLLGDTHGNMHHVHKVVRVAKRQGVDAIVQLGDFGFLWRENKVPALNNVLKQFGIPMFWLDGNHENYDMLAELGATPQDDEPTQLAEFVTYLPRGYVWEWSGVRLMSMGGAFSIDQEDRIIGIGWWPQETISNDDLDRAAARGKVDIMLCHDAPESDALMRFLWQNSWYDLATGEKYGYKTDRASHSNRVAVTAAMQAAEPKLLVHGHYHHRYNGHIANTTVAGLDRDTKGVRSYVILDLDHLDDHLAEIHP